MFVLRALLCNGCLDAVSATVAMAVVERVVDCVRVCVCCSSYGRVVGPITAYHNHVGCPRAGR